jgi:uncharacterized protein (DUF1800 family)
MTSRADVAHVLRRATFGPRADEVDAAEQAGVDATLAGLLAPTGVDAGADRTPPPALGPDPIAALDRDATRDQRLAAQKQQREQVQAITAWWLDRMVSADHQAHEKLTFFWHGHWATSVQKVRSAALMLAQQQTFRRLGTGDFGALLHAMLRDPALIFWLDGQRNTAKAPNENLARELMELFTLGIGTYTEADVKAGARALTGWQLDRAQAAATFNPQRHDAGVKTILGRTGPYDADGFADLLLAQDAHAKFIASRLWFRYASGEPVPAATLGRLVAAYTPARDVTALLRALYTDPAFAGTRGQLVRQPVEWAVGALRQLDSRPGTWTVAEQRKLGQSLDALGQVPFEPPSVGGWPSGAAWLTTSAAELRLRAADLIAGKASPAVLGRITAVPTAQRVTALSRLLVVDSFTDRTGAVLAGQADNPRRLIALALASPEYCVQ